MKTALSFTRVSFRYDLTSPTVLEHVSFALAEGSFTSIVGPSGEGKSTILRLGIGLEKPVYGAVENTAKTRMVFQNGALLPWRTVLENVLLGFTGLSLSRAEQHKRALAELDELGIKEFAHSYPRDLSGGQRQRVGIARALVSEPELLFLDEPFSALDVETAERLAREILTIHHTRNIGMLMVSHSIEDAVLMSDEILVCVHGSIVKRIPVSVPRPRSRDSEKIRKIIREVHVAIPDR
jgi:NitT/TauT family transport system ATP-binding protein